MDEQILEVLKDIREEAKQTNERLEAHVERLELLARLRQRVFDGGKN
jgi:hypothetical protein